MSVSLTDEMALAALLKARSVEIDAFDGLTTTEQRREAFRKAIAAAGAALPAGKWKGMERTLGMVFQIIYGETR